MRYSMSGKQETRKSNNLKLKKLSQPLSRAPRGVHLSCVRPAPLTNHNRHQLDTHMQPNGMTVLRRSICLLLIQLPLTVQPGSLVPVFEP